MIGDPVRVGLSGEARLFSGLKTKTVADRGKRKWCVTFVCVLFDFAIDRAVIIAWPTRRAWG